MGPEAQLTKDQSRSRSDPIHYASQVETTVDTKPSYLPGNIYDIDILTPDVNLTWRATRQDIKVLSLSLAEYYNSIFTLPNNKFLSETYSGFLSTITITAPTMLSKLSIIALLAAATFASALPADSQNSVSKRQEDWNIWFVSLLIMRFYLFFPIV